MTSNSFKTDQGYDSDFKQTRARTVTNRPGLGQYIQPTLSLVVMKLRYPTLGRCRIQILQSKSCGKTCKVLIHRYCTKIMKQNMLAIQGFLSSLLIFSKNNKDFTSYSIHTMKTN